MPVEAMTPITPLGRLAPLANPQVESHSGMAGGFSQVLNGILASQNQANVAADAAIHDLATGQAQDLHQVSLAVAQADMSFRLILELRNRLADSFQEVSRMQI